MKIHQKIKFTMMKSTSRFLAISLFFNALLLAFFAAHHFAKNSEIVDSAKSESLKEGRLVDGKILSAGTTESGLNQQFRYLSGLTAAELGIVEQDAGVFVLASLFRNFPEKGIAVFAELSPELKSDQAAYLADALMRRDPLKALNWLDSEKEDLRQEVYRDRITITLNNLALSNPEEALALANGKYQEDLFGKSVYLNVMDGYASKDMARAVDFLQNSSQYGLDDDDAVELYNVMMYRFAEKDARYAAELASQLESSDIQVSIVSGLAEKLVAAEGVEASLDWISTLSDENAQIQGLERIIDTMSRDEASAYFSANEGKDDFLSETAQKVAFEQTLSWDHQAAGDLLKQTSHKDVTEMATRLVKSWSSLDSGSALKWVQSLPDSELYDAAAAQAAPSFFTKAPLESAKLISRIGDGAKRKDTLNFFARNAPVKSIEESFALFQGVVTPEEYADLSDTYNRRIKDKTSSILIPEL